MLTNNFLKWLKGSIANSGQNAGEINLGATLVATDGVTTTDIIPATSSYPYYQYGGVLGNDLSTKTDGTPEVGKTALLVGSGSKDEKADDIALESIITGLTHISATKTKHYDESTNKVKLTFTREFQNTTGDNVIVREVALYHPIRNSSTSGGKLGNYCFVRKALFSPIVVDKGGNFTVSMTIEL